MFAARPGKGGRPHDVGAAHPESPPTIVPLARECAAVLLATPAEGSLKLAPILHALGVKVIDLSGAFRLRDASLYPKHYGFEHTHLQLLSEAFYGLPELSRARVQQPAQ